MSLKFVSMYSIMNACCVHIRILLPDLQVARLQHFRKLTSFMSPPVILHSWNMLRIFANAIGLEHLHTGDRSTFVPQGSDIKEV